MNVFKVPEALYDKYHGSGHALAATLNGQLIDLVYIEDVIEGYDGIEGDIKTAVADNRLGPIVRQLQVLGKVHVGMCSCYEFIEL